MKKLLMFLCCVFAVDGVWAGCNSPITLNYRGTQKPSDNEFLYTSIDEYNKAFYGEKNTKFTSGDAKGYECDAEYSGSCSTGDRVTMSAGHVYKGKVVNKKVTYECKTPYSLSGVYLNDVWKPVDDDVCDTREFGKVHVGYCVGGSNGCRKLTSAECSGYEKTDKENATAYYGVCSEGPKFICRAADCKPGMELDRDYKCVEYKPSCRGKNGAIISHGSEETGLCEDYVNTDEGYFVGSYECKRTCNKGNWSKLEIVSCVKGYNLDNGICVKDTPQESSLQKCLRTRTTDEGKACCYLKDNVAKFENGKCVCQNGGTFSIGSDGHGKCDVPNGGIVPPNGPVAEPDPTPNQPWPCPDYSSLYDAKYVSCDAFMNAYNDLDYYCINNVNRNETGYKQKRNLVNLAKAECDGNRLAANNLRVQVNKLSETISGRLSGWRDSLNVWKNEEGKFNAARLASDSIAGVVLGTAGGLITSHLVKKGQVKSGFEDIQCTIGGQKVADWHDEFTVGIK